MALNIAQAIDDAAGALREAGVEQPQREALVLVAWVADSSAAAILAHPERELTGAQQARLREAVRRRVRREPLAYITGRVEFYGLELAVDRRVLVPRPETEHVVEQALAIARHLVRRSLGGEEPLVADVGAGSGCIAVALAHSLDNAVVYALDASSDALAVCAANVRRHHLEQRVRLLVGDLLGPLPAPVHIIACNPPYVASGEFASLMPEVRDWEPRAALDGGADGFAVVRRLIAQAPMHLPPGGALVMEIGSTQGEAVLALAHRYFAAARIERDLAGLNRVLVAHL